MSLNPKQRRFAHEFSVDHNAAQAAKVGLGESVAQSQSHDETVREDPDITVLFWAANPVDTDALRLDEEVRTV